MSLDGNDGEFMLQLKRYLAELKGSPPRDGITHMMELLILLRYGTKDFVEFSDSQYGTESLSCLAKFADGKSYRIKISEERGAKEKLKGEDVETDKNT